MESRPLISVLTPAYNRENEIENLYNSLEQQTNKSFKWYVIDDGSTDNTAERIREFQKKTSFEIIYQHQNNQGKHSALNLGVSIIDTRYTFIVDSDDVLTSDAIDIFYKDVSEVDDDETICGIGYLRGYSSIQPIGDMYPKDRFISDFITVRVNQNVDGDKAEIWKTEDLKSVPFPIIEGERFFGEGYAWFKLAMRKKMLFVNKIIYVTEYLEGGLTKSGRALRIKCPVGGMINAEIMMHKPFNLKNRIKGAMLYTAYGKFAGKSLKDVFMGTTEKQVLVLSYLPGIVLYTKWKKYL